MQAGWKISQNLPTSNLPENLAPIFAMTSTGIFTNCSWNFNTARPAKGGKQVTQTYFEAKSVLKPVCCRTIDKI